MTPGEAVRRLAQAAEDAVAARRQALGEAAAAMRQQAEDAIGVDGGPDGSWPSLGQGTLKTKRELHQLGRVSPQDQLYATGQLRASFIVDDQDPDNPVVTSTDPVAVVHELGTSEVPPRPVLAPIAAANAEKVANRVGSAVAQAIRNALAGHP